jgi:toxin ParE1/3/4
MHFKISTQASHDVEDIYLYGFINFGEEQADLYSLRMHKCIDILCVNPEIGRLDIRVNPAVRRFDFESHVIFYDIEVPRRNDQYNPAVYQEFFYPVLVQF